MKIYDNKNPHGRAVDRGNRAFCPECQGRDGRHVLVRKSVIKKDKNGDNHVTYRDAPCSKS